MIAQQAAMIAQQNRPYLVMDAVPYRRVGTTYAGNRPDHSV